MKKFNSAMNPGRSWKQGESHTVTIEFPMGSHRDVGISSGTEKRGKIRRSVGCDGDDSKPGCNA
jgi:hypothetical protein